MSVFEEWHNQLCSLFPQHPDDPYKIFDVIFISVVVFSVLFAISHLLAATFFPSVYLKKLSSWERVDWHSRTVSNVHSLVSVYGAGYVLFFEYDTSKPDFILQYSALANLFISITVGYFIYDTITVLWIVKIKYGIREAERQAAKREAMGTVNNTEHMGINIDIDVNPDVDSGARTKKRSNESNPMSDSEQDAENAVATQTEPSKPKQKMQVWDVPIIIHHFLGIFSFLYGLANQRCLWYLVVFAMTEITTPLINNRWFLTIFDKRDSGYYTANGVAIIIGWFLFRITIVPITIWKFFFSLPVLLKLSIGLQFFTVSCLALANCLNLYWFYLIITGAYKILFAREDKKSSFETKPLLKSIKGNI